MNFQWYPGHMTKAIRMMQENIKLIDIIIELTDAWIPAAGRNPDIDELGKNKYRLVVLNKADLADPQVTKKWRDYYESQGIFVMEMNSRTGNEAGKVKDMIQKACAEKIEKDNSFQYFINDITNLKSLNHSNIIKLIETVKTKKHYYTIKEYCNGGNLTTAIEKYAKKNGNSFSEDIIQHLVSQLIDAIKYIHENKIIARYITMDNILLHYDNEEDEKNVNLMKAKIKLSDFCFAIKNKSVMNLNANYFVNDDTETIVITDLESSKQRHIIVGKKSSYDIKLIGEICFKIVFERPNDSQNKSELIYDNENKNNNNSYSLMISEELISFINSMMVSQEYKRQSISKLSKHDFLAKKINQFKKVYLKYDHDIKRYLKNEKFLDDCLEKHILTPLDIEKIN